MQTTVYIHKIWQISLLSDMQNTVIKFQTHIMIVLFWWEYQLGFTSMFYDIYSVTETVYLIVAVAFEDRMSSQTFSL